MSIQIYGFWRSIASFRVRVALQLKDLAFEEIPVDILCGEQFEPGYAAINAERVVPTVFHDGQALFQSLAILEYLDEIKPEPRLLPADARERAYARALALVTVADSHPLLVPRVRHHLAEAFGADATAIEEWCRHWTIDGLATCERLLARRPPAPFALGATPGLADICIAGHTVTAQFFKVALSDFPKVAQVAERCFAIPAFATAHPSQQPGFKAAARH